MIYLIKNRRANANAVRTLCGGNGMLDLLWLLLRVCNARCNIPCLLRPDICNWDVRMIGLP